MEWVKKHVDTVIVLGGILTSVFWMNSKFNEVEKRFSDIEKRLLRMETVMIMKGIMPPECLTVIEEDIK